MLQTNIQEDDKSNAGKGESECQEVLDYVHDNCFASVHEEFQKLMEAIQLLQQKKENELRKREDDCFELFKSQMQLMKKEYADLKGKIEEKENAIENHVLVKQLLSEKTWYKNQALQLHDEMSKMKKKLEQLEDVEKDRKWLSDRLKMILKDKTQVDQSVAK